MPNEACRAGARCRGPFRHVALICGLVLWVPALSLAQGAPGGMAGGKPAGPVEVGITIAEQSDIPYVRTLPGRAVAYEQTDIRPRVNGVIEEILYTPGGPVAAGTPLFRIEDATYRAELAAAQAALAAAEAEAEAARDTVGRYQSLSGSSVTTADLQTARASAAVAEANLVSARSAVEVARLNLDRTTVTSPIAGVVGMPKISLGSLVTANQSDALSTVVRLDPIYVDVSDSSVNMLQVRDRIAQGSLAPGDKIRLELALETGQVYGREGTLVAPATEVSTTTGTIDIRVQFDNPDQLILPGQFLRVDVTLGTVSAMLVPQRATGRTSSGMLTAWVARAGKAEQVELVSTGTYRNSWIVTDGLAPGDALIVDGLKGLSAGAEITTVPVTIDADGVVHDATAPSDDSGAAPAPQPAGAAAAGGN